MDYLQSQTSEFVEQIKKSDIYVSFLQSKKNLEMKPSLSAQFDEFRKSCFEIQLGHNYGYYNSYEQLVNLKNANDELLSHSLVKVFMEDELNMTKLIWKIFNQLVEEIEFDVDFLE
ncbi:MAG: hypothetical protein CVU84_00240 [Firmicutes bacterium HGW-Firmicutes-1]|jgi:cell fate (sporulation/competence/biofilm development) regulator YlbF (YheA/YmcA/DUF963 family)|nr:MAG: hypothetical protein CVU84_00240 [Firmicutes bacterium HGW-Firmicutes-1]